MTSSSRQIMTSFSSEDEDLIRIQPPSAFVIFYPISKMASKLWFVNQK